MVVTATYDPSLVVLSVLVAGFASYTALDLGGRVALAQGPTHRIWLAGAALAMGAGIWSMHFVAMLAFVLPMPVSYDVGLTVVSLVLAILGTSGSFYVISRPGGVSRPASSSAASSWGSPSSPCTTPAWRPCGGPSN